MKLITTQNPETNEITYTPTIEKLDLVMVNPTKLDRLLIENCKKSNLISDKLMSLEMLARKVETQTFI